MCASVLTGSRLDPESIVRVSLATTSHKEEKSGVMPNIIIAYPNHEYDYNCQLKCNPLANIVAWLSLNGTKIANWTVPYSTTQNESCIGTTLTPHVKGWPTRFCGQFETEKFECVGDCRA